MLNVAAYCRVSTEEVNQLNSLDNQKRFFTEYIEKNPNWQFTKIYIDEGISGTSTKNRDGFNQMVQDAENKTFDLLVTKEISRFARNTLDSIFYTRKLKSLGIGVLFLNDNINTLDPDAELRLTIMSSIAQEESRKTSSRVKWGQKRRMEQGVVFGTGVYGYYLQKGKLTVNPEQAYVVQLIFNLYIDERMGATLIAKELENRGILSPNGNPEWKAASILRMLKNEKYIGVLKQKKEITPDYLSQKKVINKGNEAFIIIENNHKPIIGKALFMRVQKEIQHRRTAALNQSRHSNRYAWSGKIHCMYCGARFKRRINNGKSKAPQVVWQCLTNNKYGKVKQNKQGKTVGCDNKFIHEDMLQTAFQQIIDSKIKDKDAVVKDLKNMIEKVIVGTSCCTIPDKNLQADLQRVKKRKQNLIELYTDNVITRAEFDTSNNAYLQQINFLKQKQQEAAKEDKQTENLHKQIILANKEMEKIVQARQFSEQVCLELLNRVEVKGRSEVSFYLNDDNRKWSFMFTPQKQCLHLIDRVNDL